MVILCAASCITSAPQPVFSTNVVMIAVPMPPAPPGLPAIQPQLIPHIVVTETIAGHPVPLVTGHTNAARTNIVLSFTSPGYRRLAYQNSPGQFELVVDTGQWLQSCTNPGAAHPNWTNHAFIPASGSNVTVSVEINPKIPIKAFRISPDVWVPTNQ